MAIGRINKQQLRTNISARLLVLLTAFIAAPFARPSLAAETNDAAIMPTDPASASLNRKNPALIPTKANQGGLITVGMDTTTRLKRTSVGGQDIVSAVSQHLWGGAGAISLGEGAALGFGYELDSWEANTSFSSQRRQVPHQEKMKTQSFNFSLSSELNSYFRGGIDARYSMREFTIIGAPNLNENQATEFSAGMLSYGLGLAFQLNDLAVAYSYFPTARGKSEIYGEYLMMINNGFSDVNFTYRLSGIWRVGLLYHRVLSAVDDLAKGTTAADNRTNISLGGLSPDQYLIPTQSISLGADYQWRPAAICKFAIGQDQANFDIEKRRAFSGLGLNQNGQTLLVRTQTAKAALQWAYTQFDGAIGFSFLRREFKFPEKMGSGDYSAHGQGIFVEVKMVP